MKMMHGAFFLACSNKSLTREAPTPTNISTNSEPEMEKNGTPASPATARAMRVFPVPGGPSRMTPRGIRAPSLVNRSLSFRNWTTSWSSSLAPSTPATSSKVTPVSGTIATRAPDRPRSIGLNGPPGPPPPARRVMRNSPPKSMAGKISDWSNPERPLSSTVGRTVTSTLCSVSVWRSSGSFGRASSLNRFPSISTARTRDPSAENVTFSTLLFTTAL
mmetsp:Transcript_8359/g.17029  ORF Transcript_8359/g.17029 Transcript_8359/m.17029 type:complete len:218 (-) Transcript_8359:1447-2100(-)